MIATKGRKVQRVRRPNLTENEKTVINVIEEFYYLNGLPPTEREIATILDLSNGYIHQIISSCVAKGYMTKRYYKARWHIYKGSREE